MNKTRVQLSSKNTKQSILKSYESSFTSDSEVSSSDSMVNPYENINYKSNKRDTVLFDDIERKLEYEHLVISSQIKSEEQIRKSTVSIKNIAKIKSIPAFYHQSEDIHGSTDDCDHENVPLRCSRPPPLPPINATMGIDNISMVESVNNSSNSSSTVETNNSVWKSNRTFNLNDIRNVCSSVRTIQASVIPDIKVDDDMESNDSVF